MKTCLLTLDLINEICHPEGKLAKYSDRIEASSVIPHTNQVIEWARQQHHLIAHVKVGFRSTYSDSSTASPIFCNAEKYQALALNDWGTEFCEDLDVNHDDVIIVKHRVSAFYGTDLDLILRANNIEHLVLCGVSTSNAVELTAREAHDRDYRITIVSDAVESASNDEQVASLNFLSRMTTLLTHDQLMEIGA